MVLKLVFFTLPNNMEQLFVSCFCESGKEKHSWGKTRQEKQKTKTCDHMQTGVLSNDFLIFFK